MDWLQEGRHDCPVAQALLNAWATRLQGAANESLEDFFERLLGDARECGGEGGGGEGRFCDGSGGDGSGDDVGDVDVVEDVAMGGGGEADGGVAPRAASASAAAAEAGKRAEGAEPAFPPVASD